MLEVQDVSSRLPVPAAMTAACRHVCLPRWTLTPLEPQIQRRTLGVFLCYSLPRCLEAESLIELEAF